MMINDYCINVVSRQAVLGDGGEGDALVRAQQSAIICHYQHPCAAAGGSVARRYGNAPSLTFHSFDPGSATNSGQTFQREMFKFHVKDNHDQGYLENLRTW